jgi:hypothetical protein
LGDGSSALALYPWAALADDAGVSADGTGFRGITLAYNVRSEERVDAVLAEAERAGGAIVGPARLASCEKPSPEQRIFLRLLRGDE